MKRRRNCSLPGFLRSLHIKMSDILVIFYVLGLCAITATTTPKAQTKYGPIEGTTITIFNGKQVDCFLGVPFAAPPIGQLRFASPQPPVPWIEPLKTTSFSSGCFQPISAEQKDLLWFMYRGKESEDCLYLNVFKPTHCSEKKLPVMVWIHGGAFQGGSASMPLYNGSVLAAENKVVVVTLNHRLSFFGFLYLNSSSVRGNAGIQDQIQAIKWVKENIHGFCGDSERVTLFGQSSGSQSITAHLLNPALSELFQYAILESGSFYHDALTTSETDALTTSLGVADKADCLDENDQEKMLECLRKTPAENLVNENFGFPPYLKLIFLPVRNGIEVPRDIDSTVHDVPECQRKNILSLNIPLEASLAGPLLFPDTFFSEDFTVSESEFRDLIANYFNLNDHRLQDIVLHEYRNFRAPYNASQLRTETFETLGDFVFICPVIDFIKAWAVRKAQVFYLYFYHRPSRPIRIPLPNWAEPTLGDEIPFVFGAPLDPSNGYTEAESKLSAEIMKYWTGFAKHGNPNAPDETFWPDVEPDHNFTYLELTDTFQKRTFLKERKCNFWASIYPKLLTIQDQLEEIE